MADFELDVDVNSLLRAARRYDAGERIVSDEMLRTMRRDLDVIAEAVRVRTPVGVSGIARGSITRQVFGEPLREFAGAVFMAALYGYYVENGRGPGRMPPVDAIELWLIRVKSLPKNAARQAAWAKAKAIASFGTFGAHMFRDGWLAVDEIVREDWRRLPARVTARLEGRE